MTSFRLLNLCPATFSRLLQGDSLALCYVDLFFVSGHVSLCTKITTTYNKLQLYSAFQSVRFNQPRECTSIFALPIARKLKMTRDFEIIENDPDTNFRLLLAYLAVSIGFCVIGLVRLPPQSPASGGLRSITSSAGLIAFLSTCDE